MSLPSLWKWQLTTEQLRQELAERQTIIDNAKLGPSREAAEAIRDRDQIEYEIWFREV
jgi:hypothetical protein